jgi:hypothetical protein
VNAKKPKECIVGYLLTWLWFVLLSLFFGTGVDVLRCAALWRVGPTSFAFAEQQNNTHNKISPTLIPAH